MLTLRLRPLLILLRPRTTSAHKDQLQEMEVRCSALEARYTALKQAYDDQKVANAKLMKDVLTYRSILAKAPTGMDKLITHYNRQLNLDGNQCQFCPRRVSIF